MKVPVSSHIVQKMDKCTWNDSSRNQQRLTGVIFTFLPGYVTVSVLYWCFRLTSISMLERRWDDWLFMVNNYRRCRAGNRSFVCACRLNVNVSICCRVKKGVKRRHIREYGWSHALWSVAANLTRVVPKEIPQFWSVVAVFCSLAWQTLQRWLALKSLKMFMIFSRITEMINILFLYFLTEVALRSRVQLLIYHSPRSIITSSPSILQLCLKKTLFSFQNDRVVCDVRRVVLIRLLSTGAARFNEKKSKCSSLL